MEESGSLKLAEKNQLSTYDNTQIPQDSAVTPVHQMTILEENETLRGSIDRNLGSRLNFNQNTG